jgi:hypothetical protein
MRLNRVRNWCRGKVWWGENKHQSEDNTQWRRDYAALTLVAMSAAYYSSLQKKFAFCEADSLPHHTTVAAEGRHRMALYLPIRTKVNGRGTGKRCEQ